MIYIIGTPSYIIIAEDLEHYFIICLLYILFMFVRTKRWTVPFFHCSIMFATCQFRLILTLLCKAQRISFTRMALMVQCLNNFRTSKSHGFSNHGVGLPWQQKILTPSRNISRRVVTATTTLQLFLRFQKMTMTLFCLNVHQ